MPPGGAQLVEFQETQGWNVSGREGEAFSFNILLTFGTVDGAPACGQCQLGEEATGAVMSRTITERVAIRARLVLNFFPFQTVALQAGFELTTTIEGFTERTVPRTSTEEPTRGAMATQLMGTFVLRTRRLRRQALPGVGPPMIPEQRGQPQMVVTFLEGLFMLGLRNFGLTRRRAR